jgi:mannose-6-phosphate isomerase
MTQVAPPHPISFTPLLLNKVWGGDRLARFGKTVQPGAKVGESWELADLARTSASGAGGGAAESVIAEGPLAGKTLHDAVELWGVALLGSAAPPGARTPAPGNRFPLLVKYLDARENLSVQVHPSIAYARAHPGASIKTECWYILDADPGAVIYKGVKPGVTREVFERHLRLGDGSAVLDDMEALPARVGDMHNLPSGTVHALGSGVVVAEVQTPSDTTFRVYDWGRVGRELHVDQALECITFAPARDATRRAPDADQARLVTTGYFFVDEVRLRPRGVETLAPSQPARPVVVLMLQGEGVLEAPGGEFEPVALRAGATVLVPASQAHAGRIRGEGTALRVEVLSGGE